MGRQSDLCVEEGEMIPRIRAWHKEKKEMVYFKLPDNLYELSQSWDESIVMYPPGRRDRNGIDIFTDDIVDFEGCKAIVRWDNLASMYYFESLDEDTWRDDWNFQDDAERCLIIGSIHENPEILKR